MDTEYGIGSLTRCELESNRRSFKRLIPEVPSNTSLNFHVLASGSKGNSAAIENTATGEFFVIDCGISCKRFLQALSDCHLDVSNLQGIIVTHEHSDHTKGLGVVFRTLIKQGRDVPLFVNDSVHRASKEITVLTESSNIDIRNFDEHSELCFAGMTIYPFSTHHDAARSFGFRIEREDDAIGFLTDSGVTDSVMFEYLSNVRILGIEANHDVSMLKHGPYPYSVKQRIASDRGHLSNDQAKDALSRLLSDRLEQVVALHISESNNTYRLPVETLQNYLKQEHHYAQVYCGYQNRAVSF